MEENFVFRKKKKTNTGYFTYAVLGIEENL
jgi:hypothetical protein